MFSAGCRTVSLLDGDTEYPVLVLYPSREPERSVKFGPYDFDVALDAPAALDSMPLAVISHGSGGSHLVYRTLAMHLARHGFLVAQPEHPFNNRNNNSLAGTTAILESRPRHVRQVIDWAYANFDVPHAAVIGHSMGGYTALAVAGGRPVAYPADTPVPVVPDDRVRALVLMAPATPWFLPPGSLSEVRVPILLLTAERDPHTPPGHSEIIRRALEPRLTHRVIANAGHYSFLSPFPAQMINAAFAPSQDPPGFDRERFHEELNAMVLEFLTAM